MKIIQISDLHITQSTNIQNHKDKINNMFEALQPAINKTDKIVFCVCGDIIDATSTNRYENAVPIFDHLKHVFREYNISFEFVPGNHDLVDNKFDDFNAFIKCYTPVNYDFSHTSVVHRKYDEIDLILLNSTQHLDHKYGSVEHDKFKDILTNCNLNTVIVTHHTIMSRYDSDVSQIRNAYTLVDTISKSNVFSMLHGHTHGYSDMTIGDKCKVVGVGPIFKEISHIPNQFNLINIIAGAIDSIDNYCYRGDVQNFGAVNLYTRRNIGLFNGKCVEGIYGRIVNETKLYECIYNFNMNIAISADAFFSEIEQLWPDQMDIAKQWQSKECPTTLYYNHGMYFDKGTVDGLEYIIKELNGKATSSRAILPLVSVEDVKNSGDHFFPSLDIIQFSFDNDSKNNLYVTIYLRALEVNHFLKINLCEVYIMVRKIKEVIRSVSQLNINVLAFRAQYKDKFGCFKKAKIDILDKGDLMLLVTDKKLNELKEMLEDKLELSETVVIDEGVTNLCDCITKYNNTHPGFYKNELIVELVSLQDKYQELKENRKKTSLYGVLKQLEAQLTTIMKKVIELIATMEEPSHDIR